ncbi:MAG: cation transporter [Chiayiivirga sp.]|uniref:cation transporter n=1 Tax=Chiayiivirga sp. TaxID=2041042 RepID=UPI0025C3A299|nr:cation transporter [Chiayiivirga sp.]MCI1730023.1 cation transporter [Chiayiivirga sp.]
MSECGCHVEPTQDPKQRRTLWIALLLNAAMAAVGFAIGWLAHSTGVLADALDMLSDAAAYAIGLAAIGRSALFKRRAAQWSGGILLVLGLGIVIEALRRGVVGSEPLGGWMMLAAGLSLVVNLTVLRLLRPFPAGRGAFASHLDLHPGRCRREMWACWWPQDSSPSRTRGFRM